MGAGGTPFPRTATSGHRAPSREYRRGRARGEMANVLYRSEDHGCRLQGHALVLEVPGHTQQQLLGADAGHSGIGEAGEARRHVVEGPVDLEGLVRFGHRPRRTGPPQVPPLAEGGAKRQGAAEMGFGLDAFGQHRGPGAFGVGRHRGVDGGPADVRPALHERDIEFDHIRTDERQQRQRAGQSAHIVEGDPASGLPELVDRSEQLRRPLHEGTLGDLDDQAYPACGMGQEAGGGIRAEHRRLEVHEQFELTREVVGDGIDDRRVAAGLVELGQSTDLSCPPERLIGCDPQRGPPGQRFGGNLLAGDEIEDGLVLRLQVTRVDEVAELGRRRHPQCTTSAVRGHRRSDVSQSGHCAPPRRTCFPAIRYWFTGHARVVGADPKVPRE